MLTNKSTLEYDKTKKRFQSMIGMFERRLGSYWTSWHHKPPILKWVNNAGLGASWVDIYFENNQIFERAGRVGL